MDHITPITVLISGNGSNFQAVIDAIRSGELPAKIICVISNRKDAYGLERAKNANIPFHYHNLVKYKKQHPATEKGIKQAHEEYDKELARLILEDSPELVVCLGFMHVLSPAFLDPVKDTDIKVINLHPALPGEFTGANAIERAHAAWLEGKIDRTGVMIHDVIAEVDLGVPILVKEIPFIKGVDEDISALKQRIHKVEWKAVVEGVGTAIQQLHLIKGHSLPENGTSSNDSRG
ncbi:phosphoribosylglycinamide formyltransferase [[Emmonsia] crescens]|uniref:Phosphoribosylglycinamide formyltransferase n=1 Tax=[Emmonsia] crescens TaxID=73230 RepID=A0A2B7Z6R7_9EURO|nr:phosphoribosylglycinamide formyltransferase [Emmonsia crescens]